MRVISRQQRWWIGLRTACQFCGTIVEFNRADDLAAQEPGDTKDEGSYRWHCPDCRRETISSYSRLIEDAKRLHKATTLAVKYAD